MTCAEARRLLDAWFDRELDVRASLEVEEHLKTCEGCGVHVRNLETLRSLLRDPALRRPLPKGLLRRLRPRRRAVWAAGALAAVAAAAAAILVISSPPKREPIDDFIAAHARSLLASHLTDVSSSDQQTVKPWFQGKVGYPVPVKDLAQDGFPLVGGRLEYLRDRPIAALVYRRAQHVVNLFVWPTRGLKVATTTKRGVSAVTWDEGDLRFCAISEAPRTELEGFSRAFREQRQQ